MWRSEYTCCNRYSTREIKCRIHVAKVTFKNMKKKKKKKKKKQTLCKSKLDLDLMKH
jgi:hypothetical protein